MPAVYIPTRMRIMLVDAVKMSCFFCIDNISFMYNYRL